MGSMHSMSSYHGVVFCFLFFSVLFSGDQGIFCFVRGFTLEGSQDSAYTHTQGTLRYRLLQGYLILRPNHQTGFATDLQNNRQKNLRNIDLYALCFIALEG